METRDEILEVLSQHDGDIEAAASTIASGDRRMLMYTLHIGLVHIKAQARSRRRRQLRREISPTFYRSDRGGVDIKLTDHAKRRMIAATRKLFGQDGWQIGEVNIGDFTRESLLEEAFRERRVARGHVRNAEFYEALAAPMKPGQRVRDYWSEKQFVRVKNRIWNADERPSP